MRDGVMTSESRGCFLADPVLHMVSNYVQIQVFELIETLVCPYMEFEFYHVSRFCVFGRRALKLL